MEIKIVNAFVAEFLRPEPATKMTVIGMALASVVVDAKKPAPPLQFFAQLQGRKAGKCMTEFAIVDESNKNIIARIEIPIEVSADHPSVKADEIYDIIQVKPLGKFTFGHPGDFLFQYSIDGTVKRKWRFKVIEYKK